MNFLQEFKEEAKWFGPMEWIKFLFHAIFVLVFIFIIGVVLLAIIKWAFGTVFNS